jgi:hypothetical protein
MLMATPEGEDERFQVRQDLKDTSAQPVRKWKGRSE